MKLYEYTVIQYNKKNVYYMYGPFGILIMTVPKQFIYFIHLLNDTYLYIYIYICMYVCMCMMFMVLRL